MTNENDKIIRDAQYRKGLSIAFFNATNSAIALLTPMVDKGTDLSLILNKVFEIRDKMLEEHKNYYATVIANVGVNYRAEDSIAKLKETKTKEELDTAWRMLSADERRDGEIIKVAQQLKKKYNEKV